VSWHALWRGMIFAHKFFLLRAFFCLFILLKKCRLKALLCMDARRAGQQFRGPRQYFLSILLKEIKMKIKDTVEIGDIISRNFNRSDMGYGWFSFSDECKSDLYFLAITRNKKGDELPVYFWDLEDPEINWLKSKGAELIPY
jgi:hypothetical protein